MIWGLNSTRSSHLPQEHSCLWAPHWLKSPGQRRRLNRKRNRRSGVQLSDVPGSIFQRDRAEHTDQTRSAPGVWGPLFAHVCSRALGFLTSAFLAQTKLIHIHISPLNSEWWNSINQINCMLRREMCSVTVVTIFLAVIARDATIPFFQSDLIQKIEYRLISIQYQRSFFKSM